MAPKRTKWPRDGDDDDEMAPKRHKMATRWVQSATRWPQDAARWPCLAHCYHLSLYTHALYVVSPKNMGRFAYSLQEVLSYFILRPRGLDDGAKVGYGGREGLVTLSPDGGASLSGPRMELSSSSSGGHPLPGWS